MWTSSWLRSTTQTSRTSVDWAWLSLTLLSFGHHQFFALFNFPLQPWIGRHCSAQSPQRNPSYSEFYFSLSSCSPSSSLCPSENLETCCSTACHGPAFSTKNTASANCAPHCCRDSISSNGLVLCILSRNVCACPSFAVAFVQSTHQKINSS